ncbi:MAG: mechanosensitive ion channel family protein [Anaerolineaceae bacterium]|jgi:small-conductance mechanosensitive channel|nr:mechanosensitive ion channel family protein [Anaerolineaceae bacterium]
MQFLSNYYLENSVQTWLLAVLGTVVLYGLFGLIKKMLLHRICKIAAKTQTNIDDFFCKILADLRKFFLLGLAVWIASRVLTLPTSLREGIRVVFVILVILQAGFLINRVVMYVLERRMNHETGQEQSASLKTIGQFVRGLIWAIVIVMALDTVPGLEVSTLVTTLGITGIAVAFAIQNVLADLFSALSITFDQPFIVGDVIVVDELAGTVERIGLKSTRVRSLSGELLIFSNSDLLNSRIHNFQQMNRRRVILKFGVTYQTPRKKLQAIPEMIKQVIEEREKVSFDRAHFAGFGDSTLDFEVVYWLESSAYSFYMDTQQAINLGIYERFEEEGIEFAYPTQTVFVETASQLQPMMGEAEK